MLLATSDIEIIQQAMSGMRMPYSSFSAGELSELLAYKRNNLAALVVCTDGLQDYLEDDAYDFNGEMISEFKDELATFCLYGLLCIGYFGISVEDGMPKRIDSCGKNVGKLYGSVYEQMRQDEYESCDRIESMLMDQRDNRRFLKYLRALKRQRAASFVPMLDEYRKCGEHKAIRKCLSADDVFLQVLMKLGRTYHGKSHKAYVNLFDVERMVSAIKEMVEPCRELLHDEDVVNLASYTLTDMRPIRF